jgi:predicted RNase H-like nuclease (RuvC/YqgF family)
VSAEPTEQDRKPREEPQPAGARETAEGLAGQVRQLRQQVHELATELGRTRGELERQKNEIVRLDADLDESRRLNLRAAELLDLVYSELRPHPAIDDNQPLFTGPRP